MATAEQEVERLLRWILPKTPWAGKVYSVGGYVRDEILGHPSKDLDIVVEQKDGAEKLSRFLHQNFPSQVTQAHRLGANYPIWHLRFKAPVQMDGSEFQTEGAEIDFCDTQKSGASEYGTLAEDILRRDFTVNMLARDLTTGQVQDFTGVGLKDLQAGLLRGNPQGNLNETLLDDPLRILRLIRFHLKFGWAIDPSAWECVRKNVKAISRISSERIRSELVKIMDYGKLGKAIRWMDEVGLLAEILPEISALQQVEQDVYYHSEGNVYVHTLMLLDQAKPGAVPQLSALLHDVAKAKTQIFQDQEGGAPPRIKFLGHEEVGAEMAEEILRRLKFENDLIERIKKIIRFHLRAHSSREWTDKAVRKFVRDSGDALDDILNLTEIDGLSSFGPKGYPKENIIPELRARIKTLQVIPIQKKTVLNGREVMDLLGISEGAEVGRAISLLQEIEDENAVQGIQITPERAKELLKSRFL